MEYPIRQAECLAKDDTGSEHVHGFQRKREHVDRRDSRRHDDPHPHPRDRELAVRGRRLCAQPSHTDSSDDVTKKFPSAAWGQATSSPRQPFVHDRVVAVDRPPPIDDNGRSHRVELFVEGGDLFPVGHDEGGDRLGQRRVGGVDVLDIGYLEEREEAEARLEGEFEAGAVEAADGG